MDAAPSSSSSTGPVLSVVDRRLRALRKKLNRIGRTEESLARGQPLNKEQEALLNSKPSLLAAVKELENLRPSLSHAVAREIELSFSNLKRSVDAERERVKARAAAVSDLLTILYLGKVFDLTEGQQSLMMRMHERSSCLLHDCVTDGEDEKKLLRELDLDLISRMQGLIVSRPRDSILSHKHALQKCLEHAMRWLDSSDQLIEPNVDVTYTHLREKLKRILASDYFLATPKRRIPIEVDATIANYNNVFQIQLEDSSSTRVALNEQTQGSDAEVDQEDDGTKSLLDLLPHWLISTINNLEC
ncbi:uncharacterized protein LOC127261642 isoform X2 [Andrographis paniculata]|uniref:uncharacterized protein LOC127261642 isoform X2 n=1 Tax=Andrographis paniculata TaxID=175694 RepID=UPI0021E95DAC|nr:uncharacterized protein LOC127261642 isoform X2 [Andrographis paniculata]